MALEALAKLGGVVNKQEEHRERQRGMERGI